MEWFSNKLVDDIDRYTVIFLFRHPTYAQLARAGGGGWVYHEIHRKNVAAEEGLPPDLEGYVEACKARGKELLGFGEFFQNYVDRRVNQDYDLVCVDYDRLWDNLEEFLAMVGLDAQEAARFPTRKPPRHGYDPYLVRELNTINAALIERLARMPAVSLLRRRGATGDSSRSEGPVVDRCA
jgi:hypothetical protein